MTDRKELKDEELGRVTGGAEPTHTKDQGPKYQEGTQVKFYAIRTLELQATGMIEHAAWKDGANQYFYWIRHEDIRFTIGTDVMYMDAGSREVKEEDIMYAL